jgi:hypothetical protein
MKIYHYLIFLSLISCSKNISVTVVEPNSIKINPIDTKPIFTGYKVDKTQNSRDYLDNTIVMNDIMATIFQPKVKV